MASLFVIHQGFGDDQQLWGSTLDGTFRANDAVFDGVRMSGSPSAVRYNGTLYVFHQGQMNDGQLWYTYSFSGANWGPDTQLPDILLGESPSAVVF